MDGDRQIPSTISLLAVSLVNQWALGSMRVPVSKLKVESDSERHPVSTSGLNTDVHTSAGAPMCTSVYIHTAHGQPHILHTHVITHTYARAHIHTQYIQREREWKRGEGGRQTDRQTKVGK